MTTYYYGDLRGGYDHAAQTAINYSSQHDEIVTIQVDSEDDRAGLVDALESLADEEHETDSVKNGDVTEVWAFDPDTKDDSMAWRVHVRVLN